MSIDLPPVIPPQLVDEDSMKTFISGAPSRSYIEHRVASVDIRVIGNEYLKAGEIEQILRAASTPSQAIRNLNKLYHRSDYLLVRLFYVKRGDVIFVFVQQTRLQDIKAPESIRVHFEDLIGDPDLTVGEFDKPRTLASMKSKRAGVDYSVSYAFGEDPFSTTLVLNPEPVEDYESTDFYLDAGNQGNRFVGRYFAGTGIAHRFSGGSEVSLNFEKAIVGLGETQGGKSYNGGIFNFNHPSRFGLYGIEFIYTSYERDATLLEATSSSPLDPVTSEQCLDPDATICFPPLEDPISASTDTTSILSIKGETGIAALTGEQILFSHPRHRMTFSQRFEWINDEVDSEERGILLDESYGTAELGLKYLRNTSVFGAPAQLLLQGFVKAGAGSGGTFETVEDDEENADAVLPGKRTGDFVLFRPKFGFKLDITNHLRMAIAASAQISDGNQLPQQQQYVLGGMELISAYLPGVLIGDTGSYGRFSFEGINLEINGTVVTPSIFAEHGQTRFEDAGGVFDDTRVIQDAGLRLNLKFASDLDMDMVVTESLTDKNIPEETLKQARAEFFWRVRKTF